MNPNPFSKNPALRASAVADSKPSSKPEPPVAAAEPAPTLTATSAQRQQMRSGRFAAVAGSAAAMPLAHPPPASPSESALGVVLPMFRKRVPTLDLGEKLVCLDKPGLARLKDTAPAAGPDSHFAAASRHQESKRRVYVRMASIKIMARLHGSLPTACDVSLREGF